MEDFGRQIGARTFAQVWPRNLASSYFNPLQIGVKIRNYKHPIQSQVDKQNLDLFKVRIGEVWA